jgi:hypothetical protein
MVEGLLMLGKRLMARTPGDTGVGGGGGADSIGAAWSLQRAKDGQTTPHAQAVCCCHQPPQQSGPGTASTCVLVDHLNPCAGHLHDWLQGHSITPVTVWCRCWRQHTGSHLLLPPPLRCLLLLLPSR